MKKAWASQVALVVKNPLATVGDLRGPGLIPDLKIPWRQTWQPIQYSSLENPMDRGA